MSCNKKRSYSRCGKRKKSQAWCPGAQTNDILSEVFSVLWTFRAQGPFTVEQIDMLLLNEGMMIDPDELVSAIKRGASRGLYSVSCNGATLLYAYNPNALEVNWANRTYANVAVRDRIPEPIDCYKPCSRTKGEVDGCTSCASTVRGVCTRGGCPRPSQRCS